MEVDSAIQGCIKGDPFWGEINLDAIFYEFLRDFPWKIVHCVGWCHIIFQGIPCNSTGDLGRFGNQWTQGWRFPKCESADLQFWESVSPKNHGISSHCWGLEMQNKPCYKNRGVKPRRFFWESNRWFLGRNRNRTWRSGTVGTVGQAVTWWLALEGYDCGKPSKFNTFLLPTHDGWIHGTKGIFTLDLRKRLISFFLGFWMFLGKSMANLGELRIFDQFFFAPPKKIWTPLCCHLWAWGWQLVRRRQHIWGDLKGSQLCFGCSYYLMLMLLMMMMLMMMMLLMLLMVKWNMVNKQQLGTSEKLFQE